MNINIILNNILSKDPFKIWESSCLLISISQERDKITPLTIYIDSIKNATKDIKLGGELSPNSKFLDYAITILEFYKYSSSCSCLLYLNQYELNNPIKEYEKGNVKIISSNNDPDWTTYHFVECVKCKQKFKVMGNHGGHYPVWKWKLSDQV